MINEQITRIIHTVAVVHWLRRRDHAALLSIYQHKCTTAIWPFDPRKSRLQVCFLHVELHCLVLFSSWNELMQPSGSAVQRKSSVVYQQMHNILNSADLPRNMRRQRHMNIDLY
jgi:hypothetical protein